MPKTHKILIGGTREQIDSLAKEYKVALLKLPVKSFNEMRGIINGFVESAVAGEVLLCDACSYKEDTFGLFLKLLELPDLKGLVWFYNKPLSYYPFTIRSRCEVDVLYDFSENVVRGYLAQFGKESYSADMRYLMHYPMDTAIEILNRKEAFTDILLLLDSVSNLYTYLNQIKNVDKYFAYLFYEWLSYNLIFTSTELDRCSFFRDEKFLKYLRDMFYAYLPEDERVRRVFTFMMGYRAYVA